VERVGLRVVLGGEWEIELIPIFGEIVGVVVFRCVTVLGGYMI
jgi:hypothetical protein